MRKDRANGNRGADKEGRKEGRREGEKHCSGQSSGVEMLAKRARPTEERGEVRFGEM